MLTIDKVKPLGPVVQLEASEFWRLRTLIADGDRIKMEAQAQVDALQATVNHAIAKRDAYLNELAGVYGFAATNITRYQWDDDTYAFSFLRDEQKDGA